ncbi:hypothetical protein AAFF_G00338530 [Aldrovandia affinis]|uniref:Pyrin domain-containing protein n=1 Tax=Aldrovandia affinis TaxID=143900 RepID=A0AAD7R8G8_9TELE|nr:hypothetical protein AAFF_G00338530 [Aldrovandia affinis]
MGKTVYDLILGALDSLSAEQLERFKRKLSERQEIGYGLIEKESNMAVTQRIIDKFTKKKAIVRTATVLRKIGLRDQAEDLKEAYALPARPQPAGGLILATRSQPLGATRVGNRMNIEPTPAHRISQTETRTREDFLQYSCQLTLDPNTAHRHLRLSEGNREVTRVEQDQSYPDHPERFNRRAQVLCREGLSGRSYWEAEWVGGGFYSSLI